MTRQVRRVATVMFLLFGALFVNLNYLQVLRADDLADDNRNTRTIYAEYATQRGAIVVGEGRDAEPVAESRPYDGSGPYEYERRYPDAETYAHLTGFYSITYGRNELEDGADRFLSGNAPEQFGRTIGDLLTGREPRGDDVVLTVDPDAQEAARDALGDQTGAVVALDPQTGGVLALWSNPSYDPERLATFDGEEATEYWTRTEDERRNRALRELYPPGSTFKVVTAAAALENGYRADDTFDDPQEYTPPQTTFGIGNFGDGLCNGGSPITLQQALTVSCNTTFAQLGVELGAEALVAQATAFGLNQEWDFELPTSTSTIPRALDPPATAQSAIGQRDVRVTPLQMAMIAATVANDGVLMRPRVIERVETFAGQTVREFGPQTLTLPDADDAEVITPETAATLTEMMIGVVAEGSGTNAAISGVDVAGKTGTAQTAEGQADTVWFTGFAPADDPQVAVAVVVPEGGDQGTEATGGVVAAPIARTVIEAVLDSE